MNDKYLKKFIKAYNHIILETAFEKLKTNRIPSASRKNILYKPKSRNELHKAFMNAYWIDEEDNVIVESNLIDPIENICKKIFNSEKKLILTNDEVISSISDNWKFYDELKINGKTLVFLKFDFNNEEEIKRSLSYLLSSIELEDDASMFLSSFNSHKSSFGAFINFDDSAFFLLNTKKYTKRTIVHEFIHYALCLVNEDKKIHYEMNKIDVQMLNFLNVSDEMKNEILNAINDEDELIAHLSECYEGIINLLNEYEDKMIRKDDYIEYFLSTVLNSDDLENEDTFKFYKAVNSDLLPLYAMIVAYRYDLNWKKLKSFIFDE